LTTWERISLDRPIDAHLFRDVPERPLPEPTVLRDRICATLGDLGELHPELDFVSLVAMIRQSEAASDESFLCAAMNLLRAG
jgi:hypothetical protein